jgi:hypothetical protein
MVMNLSFPFITNAHLNVSAKVYQSTHLLVNILSVEWKKLSNNVLQ